MAFRSAGRERYVAQPPAIRFSLVASGMSHVRESRMLCKKMVELFVLLLHTQVTGARRMGMTQELLALVTGIAHYLKILIRVALTGGLKLGREHGIGEALQSFLDKLHLLAVESGSPSARRMIAGAKDDVPLAQRSASINTSTYGVTYGFRSLAPEVAGESPFLDAPRDFALSNVPVPSPPSDACVACAVVVEEDCVRLGTYQRWHSNCVRCDSCGVDAAPAVTANAEDKAVVKSGRGVGDGRVISTARRPPANVDLFVWSPDGIRNNRSLGEVPIMIYCTDHAYPGCNGGFQAVSRLEQYAFLLNVALRRLHLLLKKQNVITPMPTSTCCVSPSTASPINLSSTTSADTTSLSSGETDPSRGFRDVTRMVSVRRDRKLPETARIPRRSTVVESPSSRVALSSDASVSKDNPSRNLPPEPTPADTPRLREAEKAVKKHRPLPSVPTVEGPTLTDIPQLAEAAQATLPRRSMPLKKTAPYVAERTPLEPGIMRHAGPPDIPQHAEAVQATEQRHSVSPQNLAPYVAELTPLELAIVRHAAVAVLYRSSLRDEMDLNQVLEMFEVKRQRFWERLFKAGDDRKKKGALTHRFALVGLVGPMVNCTAGRPLRRAIGASRRARWRGLVTRCIKSHTQSAVLYR